MLMCLLSVTATHAAQENNIELSQPFYQQLVEPVQTNTDKILVVEFFSYGCPYCYILEPELVSWLQDKPENVEFQRIAIPRTGRWLEYARLYYALEMISEQEAERITALIYDAIHRDKIDFNDEQRLLNWVVEQGVERTKLTSYYYSQNTLDKMNAALELAQAYQVQYVPSIYVDGKYQLLLNSQNRYQHTKEQLNHLIGIASQNR